MAKQHSTEFTIDDIPYLLESGCEQAIWPIVCERVIKHLQRVGKEAAKNQFSEATVLSATRIKKQLVSFKLTIHPKGNPFR